MSEIDQVIEGEVVPVEPAQTTALSTRLKPQTAALLGSALAFVGREIVPRLADTLLAIWDRRAASSAVSPSAPRNVVIGSQRDVPVAPPTQPSVPRAAGLGSRRRNRGRWGQR